MPIELTDNKYHDFDFEELYFEKNCDIDNIINCFFSKYKNDINDVNLVKIICDIKNLIKKDRKLLMELNGDGQYPFNRIGKTTREYYERKQMEEELEKQKKEDKDNSNELSSSE